MRKTGKLLVILLTLTMLFTACTKGDQTAQGGSDEIVLRVSWWGGDARHEATLKAIERFEEKNPGIKIKPEYTGWQGHLEKITTQLSGRTAPDVMQINWNWIYTFSKDGNGFYDLNTLREYIDLSNYDSELLKQTTVNGKVNAVPVGIGGKVFYFNKTTYDKAGVEIPKTFDDLFAAAKVFKEKLGKDYYPMDLDQYGAFLMILYYLEQKTGKPFIGPDSQVLYTKEELKEGFDFYHRLVEEGVVPSQEVRGAAGNVPVDQTPSWIQGKYGGIYEWDSAIAKFQASLEGNQELITGDYLKDIGDHKSALAKISMTFAINKDTKHPEAAAKFLNFLMSDPEAVVILGTSRGIPANKKAIEILESNSLLSGLNYEGNMKVQEFLGKGISPYFEHQELQTLYQSVIEEFGYGIISSAQAAEKIYNEVNRLLKEVSQ